MSSNNQHSNSIRRTGQIFGFFTFSFFGAAIFSCIVTNDNHCGVKQGSCEQGLKCSVCETENNGCIPISQDAGSVDGKSCEYEMSESSSSSTGSGNDNTSSSFGSSTNDSTSGTSSFDSESASEFSTGNESSSGNNSTGTESFCGDMIIDVDEECDEGLNNKQYSEASPIDCTIDCKFPICGDGNQNLKEECDEGSDLLEDDCSPTCQDSRFIFISSKSFYGNLESSEKDLCKENIDCQPNGRIPDPQSDPETFATCENKFCLPPKKYKGIELANWYCNDLSKKGTIVGNFIALLGNSTDENLEIFDGKFRLPGIHQDVVVDNGYEELMSGSLLNVAILTDEKGEAVSPSAVWTGFVKGDSSFEPSKNNCKYWGSKNILDYGAIGAAQDNIVDSLWLSLNEQSQCNNIARLYCVQI